MCFNGCKRITSVRIGPSVTSIGYNAFAGCTAWVFSADTWGDVRCYYKSGVANKVYSPGLTAGYKNDTAGAAFSTRRSEAGLRGASSRAQQAPPSFFIPAKGGVPASEVAGTHGA